MWVCVCLSECFFIYCLYIVLFGLNHRFVSGMQSLKNNFEVHTL